MKRAICLSTGPFTHLDHLVVIADLMQLPLCTTDPVQHALCQEFYPQVPSQYCNPSDLHLEYFAKDVDVVYQCGKFWNSELATILQTIYHKKVRCVFCPHGHSDKGHSGFAKESRLFHDIALVYGPHMKQLLDKEGGKYRDLVEIGNLRKAFYEKHRVYFDRIVEEKFLYGLSPQRPIIFYAPTWPALLDQRFFARCREVIDSLSMLFNIVVKLHPFVYEKDMGRALHLVLSYEHHPFVRFVDTCPLIYPFLSRADCYLGDLSSIGYDFLSFNKPIYCFPTTPTLLQECAETITHPREIIELFMQQRPDLAIKRERVYQKVFRVFKSTQVVSGAILNALSSDIT